MAAHDAQGSTLTIDDGTLANPINVVGFKSYDGFGGSVTINDITTFASAAKEKRAGLADFGSFSAVCDDDPDDAGQQECKSARLAQATREFVFRNPNASLTLNTRTFQGFITLFDSKANADGVMEANIEVEITGPVATSNT